MKTNHQASELNDNMKAAAREFSAEEQLSGGQGRKQQLFADLPHVNSAEKTRVGYLVALFSIDCLCILFGYTAASTLRLGSPVEEHGLRTLAVVLPMFVAIAAHSNVYTPEALERPFLGIGRSSRALLYACAIALSLLFSLKLSEEFSRLIFGIGTVTSLALLAGTRWKFGQYLGRKHRWTFRTRLVIVDNVSVTPHRGDFIVTAAELGITPGEAEPLIRHRLGQIMERFDSVILACPPDRRRKWSYSLQGASVDVEVLMPELSRLGALGLRSLHGEKTVVISSRPLPLVDRALKRSFDIVGAAMALIILAPAMMMITLAVRLDSRGPILFRQPRLGQNNTMFQLLKFRSMRADLSDPDGIRSTSKVDERITLVGSFLRRTSLDELPQLFNVLAGHMSIVGPRPHALGSTAENALFWHIDRRYFERHAVKPGITGLAQVRGFRGATAVKGDLTNRLKSDLEYLTDWTIWRDLRIVAATFLVLVHPKAF